MKYIIIVLVFTLVGCIIHSKPEPDMACYLDSSPVYGRFCLLSPVPLSNMGIDSCTNPTKNGGLGGDVRVSCPANAVKTCYLTDDDTWDVTYFNFYSTGFEDFDCTHFD